MIKKIIVALIVSLSFFACGRKGDPKPPEFFAPSPVVYPSARGEIDGIVLKWAAPKTNARGDDLIDLEGFVVRRARLSQGVAPSFSTIVEIPYAEKSGMPLDPTSVSFIEYKDGDVEVGGRYQYQIVAVNEEGVEGVVGNIIVVIFAGTSSSVQLL